MFCNDYECACIVLSVNYIILTQGRGNFTPNLRARIKPGQELVKPSLGDARSSAELSLGGENLEIISLLTLNK